MKKKYTKKAMYPPFANKLKIEAFSKGFPTEIAYQRYLANKNEPIGDLILKQDKRRKKKNEFLV